MDTIKLKEQAWIEEVQAKWAKEHPRTRQDLIQDVVMVLYAVGYWGAILFLLAQAMIRVGTI